MVGYLLLFVKKRAIQNKDQADDRDYIFLCNWVMYVFMFQLVLMCGWYSYVVRKADIDIISCHKGVWIYKSVSII